LTTTQKRPEYVWKKEMIQMLVSVYCIQFLAKVLKYCILFQDHWRDYLRVTMLNLTMLPTYIEDILHYFTGSPTKSYSLIFQAYGCSFSSWMCCPCSYVVNQSAAWANGCLRNRPLMFSGLVSVAQTHTHARLAI